MVPIIIIPARLASTRLPRKPLADIAGKPMILRVLETAERANLGDVVVAAADQEIYDIVHQAGGKAVLTDPLLPSGSDRVWHAVQQLDKDKRYEIIINLQGDLPNFDPTSLHQIMQVMENPFFDIGTLVSSLTPCEASNPSIVKVACYFFEGQNCVPALYFSRNLIPWGKGDLWRHVGIYAWRRKALTCFVHLPESGLEKREHLEQLRALEAGMRIGCARIAQAPCSVDTLEDLQRVRQYIGAL